MHNAKDAMVPSDSRNEFRTVEVIRDPDGVVAVISERLRDGRISVMIGREFERDGQTKRSAYLARRHLPAVGRLLNELNERLEILEDRARARHRDRKP
jgi:hypothetical protein